ncbi:MAG: hypothetical protein ACN4A7_08795 [Thermacetogeniaceae bacterium]|jgi:hypothetical protein|nr:DUF2007 domain-containing protein [Thermoanaerobacterales bacterium]NLN21588.1 hypothetical protein [Syntrophomonadaceae bacterium]
MTPEKMEGMALLAVVYPPEDLIIEGILETAGIKVFKMKESIAPVHGIAVGPLAEIKIFVPSDQLETAQDIINKSKNNN